MNKKTREWLSQYLPSEITGTLIAMLGGSLVYSLTHNSFLTAFAGTWGENIGFYSIVITRDVLSSMKVHHSKQIQYSIASTLKDMRNIIIEFGPSELLDSFVVRPFMMFVFPLMLGNVALGILMGKFAADITFYIPTIIAYELRKKHLK